MAMTQGTIGAGRVGLKRLFGIEAEEVRKEYLDIVGGNTMNTTQTSEVFKQYKGLGPMKETPEGNDADFDDMSPIWNMVVKPRLYTKGVKFSKQTQFTDQYNVLKDWTPRFVRSSMHRRNANVADMDNSGFTNTTYGQNSENLYSASHNMGGLYGYNRPLASGQVAGPNAITQDIAFGPLALEQCTADLHKQQDARGQPWYPMSKIDIKVPPALYQQARRAIRPEKLAGGNFNDPNVNRDDFNDPIQIHYYTSDKAWFARASSKKEHFMFFLLQMDYDIEQLPLGKDIMINWVAYESWYFGWMDWHGTWATLGQ
jgi:hypothetical protein